MVKFFTKEGPRATEDLLKEQIPLLLYRKGEGQVVTRTDYLKWKYRGKRTVSHLPVLLYNQLGTVRSNTLWLLGGRARRRAHSRMERPQSLLEFRVPRLFG